MKLKKAISIVLVILMIGALSACSNDTELPENSSNPSSDMSSQRVDSSSETSSETISDESSSEESSGEPEADPEPEETEAPEETSNILVVYFSRVGNTDFPEDIEVVTSASLNLQDGELVGNMQALAQMIADETEGDLFLIQTEDTYPITYRDTTDYALDEQNNDERPLLSSHVDNMEQYDVIFLGYPNWWGTIPMAVLSFLEEYDLSGKTIIPFCSHEGSGLGSGVQDITAACPGATILDGLAVRGSETVGAQDTVSNWLSSLDLPLA